MIRLFQFKNNFLQENIEMLKAEYSVIGYFDGLDMKTDADMTDQEKSRLLSDFLQYTPIKDEKDEQCDYFNIIGLRQESDQGFWEDVNKPYVFISCIRFKEKTEKIKEVIAKVEEAYEAICYTTLDSSDLIICLKSSSYKNGYEAVKKYHTIVEKCEPQNSIQKGFSVLAIQQKVLDDLSESNVTGMEEELFSVILRGILKNWNYIGEFIEKLKASLEDGTEQLFCKAYGVLGSEDIMIALKDVRSTKWFGLYAENSLMTHPAYRDVFYNIRTEIIVSSEVGEIE